MPKMRILAKRELRQLRGGGGGRIASEVTKLLGYNLKSKLDFLEE